MAEKNHHPRARTAPFEDRLNHLAEEAAAARALRQSAALHHDVMSVVGDVVVITDDACKLVYVSPNAHFIFGHTAQDILKQGRIGFLVPNDLFDPDVLVQCGEIANIDCQIRDAIGRARNLLVTVRRIARRGGAVLYVFRDVTERIKIEQDYELLSLTLERRVEGRTRELRESRERYRRLVEGLQDEYFFYATDPEGVITYLSPSVHTILGYLPDQMVGRNWREFVDKADPLYLEVEKVDRLRVAGLPTPLFYSPVLNANGGTRLFEFRDMPVRDADGRVIANEGIAKDVTERQQAEEALRRTREELERRVQQRTAELTKANEQLRDSEHRYRSVVEDQLEYIVRWRGDGLRTFVNKSYCRSRNASPEQLIGESFMPAIVEQDREALQRNLSMVSIDNPVVITEHRTVKPDGQVIWERWSNRALFDDEGRLVEFQSVGSDVTEQRKQEMQAQDRAMAAAQFRALTHRERDVMQLVVSGDANKVIARKLNLSVKTIEKHRSSLMKKLRIRSVPELVRLALLVEASGDC